MKSISIDLGGTTIKLAVVEDGRVLKQQHMPAFSGKGLLKQLPGLEKKIREMADLRTIDGMGIAFPGIVDPVAKRVLSINDKYADAGEMDLNGWCQEAFGLEMVLENDANAAVFGEYIAGSGWRAFAAKQASPGRVSWRTYCRGNERKAMHLWEQRMSGGQCQYLGSSSSGKGRSRLCRKWSEHGRPHRLPGP